MKPKVIVVTDRRIMNLQFTEKMASLCESGADMIILREKDLMEPEYRYLAIESAAICTEYGVPLCINNYPDTAKAMGIENVQLPLKKMRVLEDREELKSIGVSVHSLKESEEAAKLGADYLIVGPIFPTECKPGVEPKGPKLIGEILGKVNLPVYAIGGITPYNVKYVAIEGASGVCIRSSAMTSDNPAILFRELRTNFEAGLKHLEIAGDLV